MIDNNLKIDLLIVFRKCMNTVFKRDATVPSAGHSLEGFYTEQDSSD